jgi:hypothetical protein
VKVLQGGNEGRASDSQSASASGVWIQRERKRERQYPDPCVMNRVRSGGAIILYTGSYCYFNALAMNG